MKQVKDLIRGKKAFISFYNTPKGIASWGQGEASLDSYFTAIMIMAKSMISAGAKLDDIVQDLRRHISTLDETAPTAATEVN